MSIHSNIHSIPISLPELSFGLESRFWVRLAISTASVSPLRPCKPTTPPLVVFLFLHLFYYYFSGCLAFVGKKPEKTGPWPEPALSLYGPVPMSMSLPLRGRREGTRTSGSMARYAGPGRHRGLRARLRLAAASRAVHLAGAEYSVPRSGRGRKSPRFGVSSAEKMGGVEIGPNKNRVSISELLAAGGFLHF